MRCAITAIFLLVATCAYAEWEGFGYRGESACDYVKVTKVLNKGDESCAHDWVAEPLGAGFHAIPAVYCECGCGDGGINKICRKCLRKINESLEGSAKRRSESEYSKLNRLIGDKK